MTESLWKVLWIMALSLVTLFVILLLLEFKERLLTKRLQLVQVVVCIAEVCINMILIMVDVKIGKIYWFSIILVLDFLFFAVYHIHQFKKSN